MADPRDELVDPILGNEPGMLPPEPLRLTVRPRGVEAPPITDEARGIPGGNPYAASDVGWGSPTGADGRPSGRLFEPDQSEARQPTYGERLGLPYVDQQGGSGALGGLVKGVRDWFNAPNQPPPASNQPPSASNQRQDASKASTALAAPPDATAGPRQMWQGGLSSPTPTMENQPAPVRGFNWGVNELNDYMSGAVEAGRVINDPGATPQQVNEAYQQEARKSIGLTANLAGIGTTFAAARPGVSAGIFGGSLSKSADLPKRHLAEAMEGNGLPPNRIWRETGWMRGADSKWMNEISDLNASYIGDSFKTRLKVSQGEQLFLPDVINHPELFKAYPELRQMPVSQDATMWALGSYTPRGQNPAKIAYRPDDKDARGEVFRTLLHEIQHGIQQIEGFAKGSNASQMQAVIPGTGANKLFIEKMKSFAKPMSEEDYLSKYPGSTKNMYRDYMTDYNNKYKDYETWSQISSASEAYPRSAGENLANVVMQRPDFTPQQAAAVYPGSQMKHSFNKQFVEFNPSTGSSQASLGGLVKPREFWRGENVGDPRRISTGNEAWDRNLFMSSDKDSASMYGKTLTRFEAAPDAKILYEGSPELRKIAGQPRKNENLLDYSVRAAEAAKTAGYDAAHFTRQGDVGTVVFNRDKFTKVAAPEMQASMPLLRGKAADEAWRGVEREPKLNTTTHPFSNVGGTPISTMDSPIIKGSKIINPRTIDIEKDLSNAELIFGAGDATGAGGRLHGSKSLPFEEPVGRHGGPGYASNMLDKPIEGHPGASPVWASMKGPMGEILNIARDVESRGKVPWLTYMTGGKQYLDSSMQMVDTALQAAKSKGVSTTANEHLVKVMHSNWNTAASSKLPFPETGLKDEAALRAWIEASPQPQRAKLVKAMDTKEARSLGFPNIGELRVWNTDPRMITAPPGSAGLTMSRLYPSAGTVKSHHPAYDTAVAGTDVRTLGMQVPHEIIAPTMHASRMATLNKPEYYQRAPHLYFPGGGTHATKTEPVTNAMKDRLQEWMRKHPGGLAVAGTAGAGAAGLGSLVDPSRYEAY